MRSWPYLLPALSVVGMPLGAGCASLVGFPDVPAESAGDAGGTKSIDAGHKADSSTSHDAHAQRDVGASADAPGRNDAGVDAGVLADARTDGREASVGASQATSCARATAMTTTQGITNCGAVANDDCCATKTVAAGDFYRTLTFALTGMAITADEADPASVSTFDLDVYDVTVGRFEQYVTYLTAGGALPAAGSGKHTHLNDGNGLADVAAGVGANAFEPGWNAAWGNETLLPNGLNAGESAGELWNAILDCAGSSSTWEVKEARANLPINCVGWVQAYAFCIWDGGFLPSEAELAYASEGGAQSREVPWGIPSMIPSASYSVFNDDYPPATTPKPDGAVAFNLAPVGTSSLGVGSWGQYDLLGNVLEWTLDTYASYVSPCSDCAAVTTDTTMPRVMRGTAYSTATQGNTVTRLPTPPEPPASTYGFRCARAPH